MLPVEFCSRMEQMLGEEYPAFLESYGHERQPALRLNTQKTKVKEFLERECFTLSPVPWAQDGFYYETDETPGKHPYHEAGVYYIQEASAMAPAHYLQAVCGERILDLCGAPGGKSTQIASAMGGRGLLVSNEIHPARAKILSENVERMGITNALVLNETPQRLGKMFPEFFHRIMVDAPCSGEGMFRKQREAAEEWSPENVRMCGLRQDEILEEAYRMLAPFGRMVYSTCTFAPEENEGAVSRFLYLHPDMHLVDAELYEGMTKGRKDWYEAFARHSSPYGEGEEIPAAPGLEYTRRLFPHKLSGEGHFVAVMEKGPGQKEERRHKTACCREKTLGYREIPQLRQFAGEVLDAREEEALSGKRFLFFGNQLYLVPEELPRLSGLKVLRPGLHLGTIQKDRFVPSHAWALALRENKVQRVCRLSSKDMSVFRYLAGETFDASREEIFVSGKKEEENAVSGKTKGQPKKGWYLITVDGYSLGWGKLTGTVMKNHYPKGLRKVFF